MMKFKIVTYGCQINEYESEQFRKVFLSFGLDESNSIDDADIVLFNSCAVREKSQEKLMSEVGYVRSLEKRHSRKVLSIVTGCVATVEERRIKRIGEDSVIAVMKGTDPIEKRTNLLKDVLSNLIGSQEQEPMRVLNSGVVGYVPIIYGCNNFCTYCIVPITKGRENSRSKEAIVSEVKSLVNSGVKEITLLGQNINHYGRDLGLSSGFIEILEAVDSISGVERLRFLTAHPADFTEDAIERIANLKHIENHFHLPVQSGSNRILELMKRGYTREDYLSLVNRIRRNFGSASFTSDIIVGFPTETEEDFLLTESLVKEVRFDKVFTAAYSVRKNTPAARMPQVDDAIKNDRLNRLLAVENAITVEKNSSYIGRNVEVLVENLNGAKAYGRSPEDKLVIIENGGSLKKGQIVKVRILSADAFHLKGTLADG
ncbi:MAG: tRNA (N6-isopentenyl adenosine(37)-C2)-methylthiotransferase MiaB [Caldisericaceae bacterium]